MLATLRACRRARWCRDMEVARASLVSIRVSRVSSSGAGLSLWMYFCIEREAVAHRSANSLIRSFERTSEGGVVWTSWPRSLADVFASSTLCESSAGGGRPLLCRGWEK